VRESCSPPCDRVCRPKPPKGQVLPPRIRRFLAATFWIVATSAAAFAGSAAVVLACSQDVNTLWLAKLHTLVLLPSIVLYFLLDWWRPESRARLIGFIVPCNCHSSHGGDFAKSERILRCGYASRLPILKSIPSVPTTPAPLAQGL
jgi:hypothetical protein